MKHTPGPWMYDKNPMTVYAMYDREYIPIAIISDEEISTGEAHENAKLIAAAPELLDALINRRKAFDKSNEKYTEWIATLEVYDAMILIDQAIKKATP